MHFPLHLIIDYASKKPAEMDRAKQEFFHTITPPDEKIKELFAEWLIFDFKQAYGTSFFAEYLLKNPDNLSKKKLEVLDQIYKTNIYSEFQILSLKPDHYLDTEDILTGKTYRIFDKKGSSNSTNRGALRGRIGCVNGKWYFVGSNPLYFPIIYTPRMKNILRKEKLMVVTVKDSANILLKQNKEPLKPPEILSAKQLKEKQIELRKRYISAIKKYKVTMSFSRISEEIYREDRVNVLDFWEGLTKKGLTKEFFFHELQLLQDLWNYLPHKCLNGNSPVELYSRLKRAK